MNIFNLYRHFWDFSFANPEKIKPTHVAIYSFAIEHCNRLGWKTKFGFPTSMVMEATGIKSYSVFKKHFDELIEYGLIEIIEYSKNQYSSNIIALKENVKALDKATNKALDKALIKHGTKQSESNEQSIDSIDKQETTKPETNKPKNNIEERKLKFSNTLSDFKDSYPRDMLVKFYEYWTEKNKSETKMKFELQPTWELSKRLATWANREKGFNQPQQTNLDKPFDPTKSMQAWELGFMLKNGKLNL